jgi:hypothetical protein
LEFLDLTNCHIPYDAFPHIFRPGLQLPLKVLRLADSQHAIHLPAGAYARMVGCCPNLQELAMGGSGNGVLTDLPPTLTKLHIIHTSNSIAYRIAQLPNLKCLCVEKCSWSDLAMLALTALRRLTELRVVSGSFSEEFGAVCGRQDHNRVYHREWQVSSCHDFNAKHSYV